MKKILLIFTLLFSFFLNAQRIQKNTTYGLSFNRTGADTLFYLPNDTFPVPASYTSYKWITMKGTTLYYWNGTKWVSYSSGGGGGSPLFPLTGTGTATSNVIGDLDGHSLTIDNIPYLLVKGIPDPDTAYQMRFYGDRGAFRVGIAENDEWDDGNVGSTSFSAGNNNKSSGESSIALGEGNIASNIKSISIGIGNTSSGIYSTSIGLNNQSSGFISFSIGESNVSTDDVSMAIGFNDTASAPSAISMGSFMHVSGAYSFGINLSYVPKEFSVDSSFFLNAQKIFLKDASLSGASNGDVLTLINNATGEIGYTTPSSYTFTNGLTESGGTVKLGGTLIENTTVDGSYEFTFDTDSLKTNNFYAYAAKIDSLKISGSRIESDPTQTGLGYYLRSYAGSETELYSKYWETYIRLGEELSINTNTFVTTGAIGTTAKLAVSSFLTPSQITSDQNNYNPTGFSGSTGKAVLRLSSDASRNITGLAASTFPGEIVIIQNIGSNDIILKDESASSTAANRFAFSGDVTLTADQSITLIYDATSGRWRQINTPGSGGGGSGITIGTTTITGGTNTRVLYNNSGVVGEYTAAGLASFVNASLDHGTLTGLSDDDHTQYTLLAGRSGGQTIKGGTGTTDDLILQSTSGVGASGAEIIFKVGNNGATTAGLINNSGEFLLGGVSDQGSYVLQTNGASYFSTSSGSGQAFFADLRAGGETAAMLAGTAGSIFTYTNTGFFAIAGESSVGAFGSGNNIYYLVPAGSVNTHIGNFTYTQADIGAQLNVVTSSNSKKAVIVRGAASQSANLIEWQSSAPATLGYVDAAGAVNAIYKPLTSFTTSASSLTPDFTSYEGYGYTALAANLTINAPTGTPANGQTWWIYIKDNGTSRTLSWNAAYVAAGITLPASTTTGKAMRIGGFIANSTTYATSVEIEN